VVVVRFKGEMQYLSGGNEYNHVKTQPSVSIKRDLNPMPPEFEML